MKAFFVFAIITTVMGCGSSSNDSMSSDNELTGTWLSNCHDFLGTDDGTGNNLYNISELTFTASGYTDRYVSYTDANCANDPVEESNRFTYTAGDAVTTTDGVDATRITITPILENRPELATPIEAVYRISGVDLNFGEFVEGQVPAIDVDITYIKQ